MARKPRSKSTREVVGEFLGHLIAGAIMFLALAAVGSGVSMTVAWLPGIVHNNELVGRLQAIESFIFSVDGVFLCWWTLYSVYKAIRELMR